MRHPVSPVPALPTLGITQPALHVLGQRLTSAHKSAGDLAGR